jgi:sirohydrochlorin ferrochelatase
LLFAAGHAKRDIPEAVASLARDAALETIFTEPLGCEPQILELSHRRFEQAVTGALHVPREHSCLLLVGRGSSDPVAIAAMHEFSRLRQQQEGIATEVAFLAKARPTLAEHLPNLAAKGYRRVVVQPHLLFAGELASSVQRQVAAISAQHSQTEWLLTPLLADLAGEIGIGTEVLADWVCRRLAGASFRVVAPAGEH